MLPKPRGTSRRLFRTSALVVSALLPLLVIGLLVRSRSTTMAARGVYPSIHGEVTVGLTGGILFLSRYEMPPGVEFEGFIEGPDESVIVRGLLYEEYEPMAPAEFLLQRDSDSPHFTSWAWAGLGFVDEVMVHGERHRDLILPAWLLVAASLVPLTFVSARAARWRRRAALVAASRCPECGYDLRASPAGCPECGSRRGGSPDPTSVP